MGQKNSGANSRKFGWSDSPSYPELLVTKCFDENNGNYDRALKCYENHSKFVMKATFYEALSDYHNYREVDQKVWQKEEPNYSSALNTQFGEFIEQLQAYRH